MRRERRARDEENLATKQNTFATITIWKTLRSKSVLSAKRRYAKKQSNAASVASGSNKLNSMFPHQRRKKPRHRNSLNQSNTHRRLKLRMRTSSRQKQKEKISIKTLYWISGVLLGICALAWFVCLVQVPWQRLNPEREGELIGKMVGGLLKMSIAIAVIAWGIKRKGYKLLVVSIACVSLTVIFIYNFLDSRHKTQQKQAPQNKQMVENINRLQQFVQQGAGGSLPEFTPTGDTDTDTFFQAIRDFYAKYFQGWRQMNTKLAALQEKAVGDDGVLTNKSELSSEIRKRIVGQNIVTEFATNAVAMLANFKRNCEALRVGDEFK